MPRLSSPITEIKPHYDVVVVGSGYGGSIAASRLSRAHRRICLLERGREFQPGDFPDTPSKVWAEVQLDFPLRHFRSQTGLYDFRFNHDIHALVGCGLGGTSLINANVVLRPADWVLQDVAWPKAVRPAELQQGFERVEGMLKPTAYPPPPRFPPLPKLLALEEARKRLDADGRAAGFERPRIAVNFNDIVNHVGLEQHACALCGDCVSGCNYGAKNTLMMNYLPDAKAHGAEIYTEVSVRHVEQRGGKWLVHYDLPDSGRQRFSATTMVVAAEIVVLAAGSLGSTEILLRSRLKGLSVSDQLGRGFSANGDMLAVGYNSGEPINGVGFGRDRPERREPVGPCITGTIDLRDQPVEGEGIIVQEGSIPGALAAVLPFVLATAAALAGRAPTLGLAESVKAEIRRWWRFLSGPRSGAVRNTQTFLVMGHDDAGGRLALESDRLRVLWPDAEHQPLLRHVDRLLHDTSSSLYGILVRNPFKPIVVHPLGGCRMADNAATGVVGHDGRVFKGPAGQQPGETYEGLYVCDAAVVPRALGANPLWTISALAERMCALLADQYNWKIDYAFLNTVRELPTLDAPRDALSFSEAQRLGIQFTERMTGYIARDGGDDYRGAAERGRRDGHSVELTITVMSDDLESMVNDSRHSARFVGTMTASCLSSRPMTIYEGTFNWFVVVPDLVETRELRYRMRAVAETGETFAVEAVKRVTNSPVTRAWPDLTTLSLTVTGDAGPSAGTWRGMLRISLMDFLRSLRTVRARHARSLAQRLDASLRYLVAFANFVAASYARILAPALVGTADVPPRQISVHSAADRPQPQQFNVQTSDRTVVHLTRYQSGTKGPVMLAPGFGVAAKSFETDTVEVNLVDYLCQRGYDVWLLDYRASPAFAGAGHSFTIDDIALKDYPAVVSQMLKVTKRANIQAIVHCVGSLSFFMSLLHGSLDKQVRSVVASQLAVHPITPTWNELKVAFRLSTLFRLLGVRTMTTGFNPSRWSDWAIDQLLRLHPTRERCNNPVCRRILFVFGESYRHAQLNTETHDAIARWFGIVNFKAMTHLSHMVRAGHAVNVDGQDVYMPHVRKLRFPIWFMHGCLNQEFLPESTQTTFEWLRKHNPPELYTRTLFPGYGHMDCFVGKRAAQDIYPCILRELDRYN